MTLAKIENGSVTEYPVSYFQFKKSFPNTSFPKDLSTVDLDAFGYVNVVAAAAPSFNSNTEKVVESTPALIDGAWVQQWSKTSLPDDVQAANLAAAQVEKEKTIRATRDIKLAETDYLALSDATLTDEMRAYRQALRDVPAQSGFPDNITWPTKPS